MRKKCPQIVCGWKFTPDPAREFTMLSLIPKSAGDGINPGVSLEERKHLSSRQLDFTVNKCKDKKV